MLAQQSLPRVAALSHVMRLVARQCSAQRQPLSRRDCLRGLSTHTAAATTQAARRPVLTIWATARAQCGVQCRSSSSDNGPISSSRSLDEGAADGDSGSGALKLSESEPGVERQEDDFRPAEARPSIAAAAAAASRDDTEAGAAEQPSEATGPLRPLSTYREALAAWFYARKDDLKEALGAPAITVFGRQFDFRSMLKSSPVDFRRVLDLSVWPSTSSDEDSPGNATSKGSSQQSADGAAPGGAAQPRRHPAAEALLRGGHPALGFGFSAGGLLFPYYIGVMYGLHDLGVITPETRIGGASAGSLAAVCYHSGLPEDTVTDACLVLCDDCRRNGTRGRLRNVLQLFLEKLLPADIHERCSGKAYVAVTTVFPRPRGLLVSSWSSREDLIAALLTSCHIPWWFDSSVWTSFRGRASYDGGLTNFIPLPPPAQYGVRVCCFPSKQVSSIYEIAISPDSFEDWPIPLNQMVSWAFEPADEETLRFYIAKGRADAKAWSEATGVLDVLREGKEAEQDAASTEDRLVDRAAAAQPLARAA